MFIQKIAILWILISQLIMFSFIGFNVFQKNIEYKIREKIEKSTVVIMNKTDNHGGSGLVVKFNDKKFILTNAHVCKKENKKQLEKWLIKSYKKEFFNVYEKDKISNPKLDYCLINYSLGTIAPYDLERKSILFKLADLFLKNNKTLIHYTRNRTKNNKIIKRKTKELRYEFISNFSNGKENKSSIKYHSYVVDLKVVGGDSGSPIFDNLGNFKGQIFAQSIKVPLNSSKNEKEYKNRKDEEKDVYYSYMTKYEDMDYFIQRDLKYYDRKK